MDRLLKLSGTAFLYLTSSLFVAQLILFAYLSYAWKIDKEKRTQMIAIAQGFDLFQTEERIRLAVEEKVQQMTYDEVLKYRAVGRLKVDYENMRSGQLEDAVMNETRVLDEKRKEINQIALNLQKKIDDLDEEAKSAGLANLVQNMEMLKPNLAKKQIVKMLENDQEDRVILILRAMEDSSRKKLLNEMKLDDDVEKVADLFRRIGDGEPEARLLDETRNLNR